MNASEIRKGIVLFYNGAPHRVLEFQHRTPGNLRAFVQARIRNLKTGLRVHSRSAPCAATTRGGFASVHAPAGELASVSMPSALRARAMNLLAWP